MGITTFCLKSPQRHILFFMFEQLKITSLLSRTKPSNFSILSQNCIPQSLKDFIIVNSYQLDHISLIIPSPSYSCCTGQLAVVKLLHLVSKINNSSDGLVDISVEYKDLRMDEIENRG